MILLVVSLTGATAMAQDSSMTSLIGPLINLGAVGICLVALALWYIRKDKKYEVGDNAKK